MQLYQNATWQLNGVTESVTLVVDLLISLQVVFVNGTVEVQNYYVLIGQWEASLLRIVIQSTMQSFQGNLLCAVVILPVHLLVRRVVLLLSASVKKLWPNLPDRSAVLPYGTRMCCG